MGSDQGSGERARADLQRAPDEVLLRRGIPDLETDDPGFDVVDGRKPGLVGGALVGGHWIGCFSVPHDDAVQGWNDDVHGLGAGVVEEPQHGAPVGVIQGDSQPIHQVCDFGLPSGICHGHTNMP